MILFPDPGNRCQGWFNQLLIYGGFAEGVHLFPYRTEKLSPSWPMVLHHNAGE